MEMEGKADIMTDNVIISVGNLTKFIIYYS